MKVIPKFYSHCQEFVDTLERTVDPEEVLFVCAFSIYQNEAQNAELTGHIAAACSADHARTTRDLASPSRSDPLHGTALLGGSCRTSRLS